MLLDFDSIADIEMKERRKLAVEFVKQLKEHDTDVYNLAITLKRTQMSSKIKSREELKQELQKSRQQGKTIVTTNGCFDILHIGHVKYLKAAKQLGDVLVVAINSDDSVRAIKGGKRPLVQEDERAEVLAALECVDYVMIFPELDPIQFLYELRPDIHVKGGDYSPDQVVEREAVKSIGCQLRIMPGAPGKSTSNLIKLILERYGS